MVSANAVCHAAVQFRRENERRLQPRRQAKVLGKYLAILGCCMALFGLNAALHGLVASYAARVDDLTGQLLAEQNLGERIEIDLAHLSSYARIAREAETRLAMHAPAPDEIRFVGLTVPAIETGTAAARRDVQAGADRTGLLATVDGWLRAFGQTAASTL